MQSKETTSAQRTTEELQAFNVPDDPRQINAIFRSVDAFLAKAVPCVACCALATGTLLWALDFRRSLMVAVGGPALLCFLIFCHWVHQRCFSADLSTLPRAPYRFGYLMGHGVQYNEGVHNWATQTHEELGDLFVMHRSAPAFGLGGDPCVMIRDAELLHVVCNNTDLFAKDAEGFDKGWLYRLDAFLSRFLRMPQIWDIHDLIQPNIGDSLPNLPKSVWRAPKRAIGPMLAPDNIKALTPYIQQHVDATLDEWCTRCADAAMRSAVLDDTISVDLLAEIDTLVLDCAIAIICGDDYTAFGETGKALRDHFLESIHYHGSIKTQMPWWQRIIPIGWDPEVRSRMQRAQRLTAEVLKLRKAEPAWAEGYPERNDLMSRLLAAQKENKDLTDGLITDLACNLLIAGGETNVPATAFTLLHIARHPDVLEKVQQEVDNVLADGPLTHNAVSQLPYLKRCYDEAMRLSAPATILNRLLTKKWTIPSGPHKGKKLPAGTQILYCMHAVHHKKEYYPKPAAYDPTRFEPEAAAARCPYAYMPFGAGSRQCAGRRLATLEAMTFMAKVVQRFDLVPAPDYRPEYVKSWICWSANGVRLRVSPRDTDPWVSVPVQGPPGD